MTKLREWGFKKQPTLLCFTWVLTWDWAAARQVWEAFQRQILGLDLKLCRMEWKVVSYKVHPPGQYTHCSSACASLSPAFQREIQTGFILPVWFERSIGIFSIQDHFTWQMTPGPKILVYLNNYPMQGEYSAQFIEERKLLEHPHIEPMGSIIFHLLMNSSSKSYQ